MNAPFKYISQTPAKMFDLKARIGPLSAESDTAL
jgi:hypothetical protein